MINTADLKGKKVFSASGEPLFEEPVAKSTQQPFIFSPQITVQSPEINIPATVVNVDSPDLSPAIEAITDAILQGMSAITIPAPEITIEAPQPVDMAPVAKAMSALAGVMREANSKPDHGEAIIGLLSAIASKPQISSWSFKVKRDANGDVEDVVATPERITPAEAQSND
jgi:hypothetical protein